MPTLNPSVRQKSKVLSRPSKPYSPSPGSDYNLHRNITLGKDWCLPLRLWLHKTQDPTFLAAWNFLRWWLPAATRTFHLEKTTALIPTCDKPLDLANNSEEDNNSPSSELPYASSYAPSGCYISWDLCRYLCRLTKSRWVWMAILLKDFQCQYLHFYSESWLADPVNWADAALNLDTLVHCIWMDSSPILWSIG